MNLEVVAPELQERDIYGSRDSINKETLDNDQVLRQAMAPKETAARDFRQEVSNVEVPTVQQIQQPIQAEQVRYTRCYSSKKESVANENYEKITIVKRSVGAGQLRVRLERPEHVPGDGRADGSALAGARAGAAEPGRRERRGAERHTVSPRGPRPVEQHRSAPQRSDRPGAVRPGRRRRRRHGRPEDV